MSRRRVLAALVVAGLAVGGGLMSNALVRQMLYPAPSVSVPGVPPTPLRGVAVRAGGRSVSTWWLPPAAPGAPLVLMLHGNGENLETMRRAGTFELFHGLGVGVAAIDYPGYGRSPGRPEESANIAAAAAALDWLSARAEGRPVVVAGWSLGAAVAAQLAARPAAAIQGLVLMSPWTDLRSIARLHFPAWLVGALLDERYDTLQVAASIRAPSLVLHGSLDELIPVDQGRSVFAALTSPKQWLEIERAGHNDLLAQPEAWRQLGRFLAELPEQPVSPRPPT